MKVWSRMAVSLGMLLSVFVCGQEPPALLYQPLLFPPPASADLQRNAYNNVVSAVDYFRNTAQTAGQYANGYFILWDQFRRVRILFTAFEQSLSQAQLARGADVLAELEEGLVIIQEGLDAIQTVPNVGLTYHFAVTREYRVMVQAVTEWTRRLNRIGGRLMVGRPF